MSGAQETAAQLDASIDDLLRQRGGVRLLEEGNLTATARVLRDALPRFHPRFGFEELLAARLAAARRMERSMSLGEPRAIEVAVDASDHGDESADRRRRGLVAGGAIASGVSIAVPIAGAALVVWRRTRSSGGIL